MKYKSLRGMYSNTTVCNAFSILHLENDNPLDKHLLHKL